MKSKILFLVFITFLCSCEPRIDSDTRIQVKGQLIGINDNPIPNQRINIFTFKPGDTRRSIFLGIPIIDEDLFLGSGLTDDDGQFDIISLNRNGFSLAVENEDGSMNFLGGFTIEPSDVDNLFDFGRLIVGEPTLFSISFLNNTVEDISINYSVDLTVDSCISEQASSTESQNGSCIVETEITDSFIVRAGSQDVINLQAIVGRPARLSYRTSVSSTENTFQIDAVEPNSVLDVVL